MFISQSGWLLIVLMVTVVTLPYLLRRGSHLQGMTMPPVLQRLKPHYWLSYMIGILGLLHAGLALASASFVRMNIWGLLFALIAAVLAGTQLLLGRRLSQPREPQRGELKRSHFRITILLVLTALGHILLNSPTFRMLINPN